jgi:hypothetical protein
VATTIYAKRCAELKDRYTANSKLEKPSFVTQFNCLWALANLGRLSRMNCIWLGKRVHEMIETWTEQDQREMLDRLQERQARAWKRWEKRIAEKQAAKEAKKGWRFGRSPKQEAPAQTTPPAPGSIDPWDLIG